MVWRRQPLPYHVSMKSSPCYAAAARSHRAVLTLKRQAKTPTLNDRVLVYEKRIGSVIRHGIGDGGSPNECSGKVDRQK